MNKKYTYRITYACSNNKWCMVDVQLAYKLKPTYPMIEELEKYVAKQVGVESAKMISYMQIYD